MRSSKRLSGAIYGITPSNIQTGSLKHLTYEQRGTFAGFGFSDKEKAEYGIKNFGDVVIDNFDRNPFYTSKFNYLNLSSTCSGDSGGPLFLSSNLDSILGVSSWGIGPCEFGRESGYTNVSLHRHWLNMVLGSFEIGGGYMGPYYPFKDFRTAKFSKSDHLTKVDVDQIKYKVPLGVRKLVVTLNSQDKNERQLLESGDVEVGYIENGKWVDCAKLFPYSSCVINNPVANKSYTFYVGNNSLNVGYDYQFNATAYRIKQCAGDCDGDGEVSTSEILNIYGNVFDQTPVTCQRADSNYNGDIDGGDLIRAYYNYARGTCD